MNTVIISVNMQEQEHKAIQEALAKRFQSNQDRGFIYRLAIANFEKLEKLSAK